MINNLVAVAQGVAIEVEVGEDDTDALTDWCRQPPHTSQVGGVVTGPSRRRDLAWRLLHVDVARPI